MNTTSKWTPEEITWLRKNYPLNGVKFCRQHLQLKTEKQIKSKCAKMKLSLKQGIQSIIIKNWHKENPKHNFSVNPDQFFNIKTAEVAYILGLLWADGTVYNKRYYHTISIECTLEDFKIFSPILLTTGRWNCYYRNRPNRKPQGCAKICNKPLVAFLLSHGYGAKTSESACKIISKIPDHLKHYWYRGYLDGDGCIGKDGRLEFSSSYNQKWDFLINIFNDMKLTYYNRLHKHTKNGNIHSSSSIRLNKKQSTIFGTYVYQNYKKDNIGLNRKYQKYIRHL